MTLLEQVSPDVVREASIPVLETERLVLRAPCLDDVKAITALAGDSRIAENTSRIPHPYRAEHAETFIASINKGGGETALLVTLAGEPIGACGVGSRDGGAIEVGYWIGAPFWGSGYATEALRAMVDHAFTDLALDALQANARVTNPASRRVLEKCGFQWTGVGLCRVRALASSVPVDRFRLERSIWASLKSWGAAKRVA